jgi:plastocyanin
MESRKLFLLGVAVAAGLLSAIVGLTIVPSAAQTGTTPDSSIGDNQRPSFLFTLYKKYHEYENGVFTVRAGGGGPVAPMTWFFPRVAEIKAGETVTWINPTTVGEPHTITFVRGENMFAEFAAPFVVSNANTTFSSAVPNANAEAMVMPGPNGTNIAIIANNRSISPTVVKADGSVEYLQPNSTYTVDGTEKYINSGFTWPADQVPPGFPPINTFSLKFENVGTYDYICALHPWMTGQVVVE